MKELNKKVLGIAVFLMTVAMLAIPVMAAPATEKVSVSMKLDMDARSNVSSDAGNNVISVRTLDGGFIAGPVVGDCTRVVVLSLKFKANSANPFVGPIPPYTTQQTIDVTNAIVTLGDVVATGEFVIKVNGLGGNIKWTIISSDLMSGGKPVTLHGNGDLIALGITVPGVDGGFYTMHNDLVGDLFFT